MSSVITSRDNPLVKNLRRLLRESTAYRKLGQVWLEGDHLCRAAHARGVTASVAVFAHTAWQTHTAALSAPPPDTTATQDSPAAADPWAWARQAQRTVVLADTVFADISPLPSPAGMGCLVPWQSHNMAQPGLPTVVLDGVQDAGNTGSILRSAAALGFVQVLAMKGSAALWGSKVVRAGMGAHFALRLVESCEPQVLDALDLPLLVTSSHHGQWLHQSHLPWPCAWALGHEGQGVSAAVQQRAAQQVRIAQPGGEESLNVAAAAAICLHASATAAITAMV